MKKTAIFLLAMCLAANSFFIMFDGPSEREKNIRADVRTPDLVKEISGGRRSEWFNDTIDSGLYIYNSTSLATGTDNLPRVVYIYYKYHHNMSTTSLRYAYFNGREWMTQNVTNHVVDWGVSLALDRNNTPHIVYIDSGRDLNYATFSRDHWILETIDYGSHYKGFTDMDIAVDTSDRVHISYIEDEELKYAVKKEFNNGSKYWDREKLIDDYYMTGQTSIAIDSSGKPHITYVTKHYDGGSNRPGIVHTYKASNNWSTELAVEVNYGYYGIGIPHELKLDSQDRVHIGYFSYDNFSYDHEIRYAKKTDQWKDVLLDEVGYTREVSMDVDTRDNPHILYWDGDEDALIYTRFNGEEWIYENLINDGAWVDATDLAVDAHKRAHVIYKVGYEGEKLLYSVNAGELLFAHAGRDEVIVKGMSLEFDGSRSSPEKEIVNYTWSFEHQGETRYLYGVTPSFTFETFGEYEVTLTVTDIEGNSSQDAMVVEVLDRSHPSARAGSNKTIEEGMAVTLRANGSSGEVALANYTWALPGSVHLYGKVVAHRFDEAGVFDVTLNVTDVAGYWDTDVVRVFVQKKGIWERTTIDKDNYGGNYSAIAVDSQNEPHILYTDRDEDELIYKYRTGGVWEEDRIDEVGYYGAYPSVVLDSEDNPHISYFKDTDVYYAHFDGEEWKKENIVDDGWTYKNNAIALDSQDHPHISYYDSYDDDPKYAYFDGEEWNVESVDIDGEYEGGDIYLEITRDDKPVIVFSAYTHNGSALLYAFQEKGLWETEIIDLVGWQRYSVAFDPQGEPHAIYKTGNEDDWYWDNRSGDARYREGRWNSDLIYARREGGEWTYETLDAETKYDYFSLDLDDRGNPHFSYYDHSDALYKYAEFDGEEWSEQVIDFERNGAGHTRLALDKNNSAHVVYFCNDYFPEFDEKLNYAYREIERVVAEAGDNQTSVEGAVVSFDGGKSVPRGKIANYTWTFTHDGENIELYGGRPSFRFNIVGLYEIVLTVRTEGGNTASDTTYLVVKDMRAWQLSPVDARTGVNGTSVATTENNVPHMTYYSPEGLKYARLGKWGWTNESLIDMDTGFRHCSLALDPRGDPRIAFYDPSYTELRYTYSEDGKWQSEAVDSKGDVGLYPSLAVDDEGNPHVSYYDADNSMLKYAYSDGDGWEKRIIEGSEGASAGPDVGRYSTLKLDSRGDPVIAYYNWSSADLRIARSTGTDRITETVDAEGDVGKYLSMALDSRDDPHLLYYNEISWDRGSLKYAHLQRGEWKIEALDPAVLNGGGAAISLDSRDDPHVTYYDWDSGELRYASKREGKLTTDVIDSYEDGGELSMDLDTFNRPHISYYRGGELYYAFREVREFKANAGPDLEVSVGAEVVLNATSSSPLENIVEFRWDFMFGGENKSLAGSTAVFTFDRTGSYKIKLTVTDIRGLTDTDHLIVNVSTYTPDEKKYNVTVGPFTDENNNTLEGLEVEFEYENETYSARTDEEGFLEVTDFPLPNLPNGTSLSAVIDGETVEWSYGEPLVYEEDGVAKRKRSSEGGDLPLFWFVLAAVLIAGIVIAFVLIKTDVPA